MNTNKLLIGNYEKLVEQCQNLQQELKLKNKIIELMVSDMVNLPKWEDNNKIIEKYNKKAIEGLVVEQNKKVAEGN